MTVSPPSLPPLVAGDRLDREEFLRRWESSPEIKKAELIRGIVYMPSPVSVLHGDTDNILATWLGVYAASTPGCISSTNATTFMGEDAPQPDNHLRLIPEVGGKSHLQGQYVQGAIELAAEVCLSNTSYDLHQKLDLHQEQGVQEYLTVLLHEQEVRWHEWTPNGYVNLEVPENEILQSRVFPGLWLQVHALLHGNSSDVLAALHTGLKSKEHQDFVALLRERKEKTK